jgi:hypothetical protein
MIDHKNFNPRLIEMLTRSEYLALDERPTRELIQHVLDNPHELWDRPYRQHMSEDARTVLLAMVINGAFVGITLLKDSFVRVATALGTTLRPSEIEARFRAAYQEIEGSALSLLNNLVHFTNPGLRDYLRDVIRVDRLMPLIVPYIETASELGECFAIFRAHRGDWKGSTPVWTAALDRVRDGGRAKRFAYLELALELCNELRDQELIDRMLVALVGIEQEGIDEKEVREICSLLERSAMTLLPTEVEARVRSVATEAAATMLEKKAMCLPRTRPAWDVDRQRFDGAGIKCPYSSCAASSASATAWASRSASFSGLNPRLREIGRPAPFQCMSPNRKAPSS